MLVRKHDNEVAGLKKDKSDADARIALLAKENEELRRALEEKDRKLEASETRLRDLEDRQAGSGSDEEAEDDLGPQNARLRLELAAETAGRQTAENMRDFAMQKQSQLQDRADELTREAGEVEEKLYRAKQDIIACEERAVEARKEHDGLLADADKACRDARDQARDLRSDLSVQKKSVAVTKSTIATLETEQGKLSGRVGELTRTLAGKERDLAGANGRADSLAQSIKGKERDLENANRQVRALEQDVKDRDSSLDTAAGLAQAQTARITGLLQLGEGFGEVVGPLISAIAQVPVAGKDWLAQADEVRSAPVVHPNASSEAAYLASLQPWEVLAPWSAQVGPAVHSDLLIGAPDLLVMAMSARLGLGGQDVDMTEYLGILAHQLSALDALRVSPIMELVGALVGRCQNGSVSSLLALWRVLVVLRQKWVQGDALDGHFEVVLDHAHQHSPCAELLAAMRSGDGVRRFCEESGVVSQDGACGLLAKPRSGTFLLLDLNGRKVREVASGRAGWRDDSVLEISGPDGALFSVHMSDRLMQWYFVNLV